MLVSTQSRRVQIPSSADAVLVLTSSGVAAGGSLGIGRPALSRAATTIRELHHALRRA